MTPNSINLLLVEDNPGDARLIREMLREHGSQHVELAHVECMADAELHLAKQLVDIILLDLGLPDVQGLEAVRRAHHAAPHSPLVVLSGLDDESMAVQALQEGAQDYLIKGQFEARALPRALRYAIERKAMEEIRERGEEALRSSETRLRRLLDSNIIGVTFWKLNGDIVNANELFLKMIGYTRKDLQQNHLRWPDLTAPEFASADAKAHVEMADTGSCIPFEKELIRKDGGRVRVLVGSALFEGQDETGSSFVMDISAHKQSEARLRLQGAALNAADNAMVISERDLSIVWVNPAFTRLTGYTDEESIGRNTHELLMSGVHDQAFYKDIADKLLAGETWSGEMTNRSKDGRMYPEAQTITPVKDEDDTIRHFISIKTDLTAQRHMEAQLRQAQKMEAVGQLAAGVAHEFNNLLQALMSMAAITRLKALTPEIAKIGMEMEFQIKRGASLTQQLLLFSRGHALEKSDLDLREQVQKAGLLLRRLIPENISIVVEHSPECVPVAGDAAQMQQVLMNLAINARDAMLSGGTLTLRTGCDAGEAFLEVEDTGHGVDDATRARLFEPFFTTKELGKGTGLGLAVVHGIVQEHGGRIDVESRVGEGSRFRVILPATDRPIILTTAPDGDDVVLPAGNGRVLLVEDEEGVRTAVALLLDIIGYDVITTSSGEQALTIPLEPAPDLVLSDVTLPGIAGAPLMNRLRARWPSLKVVLMSGYIDEALRANAIAQGWHFLQKPFELADLTNHLHAALEGRAPSSSGAPTPCAPAADDGDKVTHQKALAAAADVAKPRPAA